MAILGKMIYATGLEKLPKVQSGHTGARDSVAWAIASEITDLRSNPFSAFLKLFCYYLNFYYETTWSRCHKQILHNWNNAL